MTAQLKPLEPFKKKMNVFSGLRVLLDDNPNYPALVRRRRHRHRHLAHQGSAQFDSKTIDQTIADVISHGTRFKSVAAAAAGDPKQSYSSLGGANTLPAEASPLSLYTRLFGPGFQDPSKGDWKPDPQVMLQQSVLSVVADDRKRVMQNLGAADRRAWTSISPRCARPSCRWRPNCSAPRSWPRSRSPTRRRKWRCNNALPNLRKVTPLMARLGALALATDQTRVFNSQRFRARLADLRAGRPAGLSPVHP